MIGPMGADGTSQQRTAIVTGGSSGIGAAVCLALARTGVKVAVLGRDETRVAASAAACRAASPHGVDGVLGLPGTDVREERSVASAIDAILQRFGRIDVLITSAAIGRSQTSASLLPAPVATLAAAAWDEVIATNLKGVFLVNRAVLPTMIRQGSGAIVNISSAPVLAAPRPYAAAYSASKFGIVGLSEALAAEVRPDGIRVHVLFPDMVDTPLIRGTTLGANGVLAPTRVADFIVALLGMPEDAVLVHPIVAPFGIPRHAPAADANGAGVVHTKAGSFSQERGTRA
jgi:3-oxoacyl-[acyl-carrier protein] reductase